MIKQFIDNLLSQRAEVSVQYRLGVFGFLGASELRARDPRGSTGNYGA